MIDLNDHNEKASMFWIYSTGVLYAGRLGEKSEMKHPAMFPNQGHVIAFILVCIA